MNELVNALYVIILTLNLFALANGRILSVINIVAVQGVILGVLPLLIHRETGLALAFHRSRRLQ